jgi:hypothetical protein
MVEYWNSGILVKDYHYLKPKKIGIFSIQIMSSIYPVRNNAALEFLTGFTLLFHHSIIPKFHFRNPHPPISPSSPWG